ncbi:hypothetical protein [Flavobacterium sp. NRK1]|uniref:hypothetical protein n=1 Tax=Flavobacterium sp. NRK1 TaxID=2954929 RepID=UPI0020923FA0|nr:hypothetical protein [Flavobacterium sp. NRK1]MCO6147719.1 hypothetical protein [Flavobacterium sp. NRK1]
METIDIFKNIVFELRNWYAQEKNVSISDFNDINDFTILKLIKLHFFVVAINSENNADLLYKNKFVAMPFGPVETTIYDEYKRTTDFDQFYFQGDKLIFNDNTSVPFIEEPLKTSIIYSIDLLKKFEPRLIVANAGSLVSLTHTWNSWKKYYNLAIHKGKFSEPIPPEAIISDLKIVNLNFI